jgi:hypothetical protein
MTDTDQSPRARGFVRRHYLGEYSFPRSFWLHTILLSWFTPIAALTLLSSNSWHIQGRLASFAFLAVLVMFYPLLFWGMAGTARASKVYGQNGGRKIWVSTAMLATTLLFMDSLYFFISTRAMVMEHVRMAFTGRYGPPASIAMIKNGTGLLVTGELREGSAEAFTRAMTNAPGVSSITLDSKGGLLEEASLLAKSISQHGLDTYVEGECSSACTFVFLAGRRRCAAEGARVGFHAAAYVRDLSRRTFQDVADHERDLYLGAGLPRKFVDAIVETPNLRVWYPSHQELLEARVTTPGCP